MWDRIKSLFAPIDTRTELERLLDESIELGREHDALREKRKAVKARIDALLANTTVQGQALTAKSDLGA